MIVTLDFLPVTCWLILVAYYLLLGTCYLKLVNRYLSPIFVTRYLLTNTDTRSLILTLRWLLNLPKFMLSYKTVVRASPKLRLPSKVVFRQRSSSVKGRLPSKVVLHQRLSSIEGRLPSNVVFWPWAAPELPPRYPQSESSKMSLVV